MVVVILLMAVVVIGLLGVALAREVRGDRPVHPPRSHRHEGPAVTFR
jgi:hypothetical protein